jgi:hypothetical protein
MRIQNDNVKVLKRSKHGIVLMQVNNAHINTLNMVCMAFKINYHFGLASSLLTCFVCHHYRFQFLTTYKSNNSPRYHGWGIILIIPHVQLKPRRCCEPPRWDRWKMTHIQRSDDRYGRPTPYCNESLLCLHRILKGSCHWCYGLCQLWQADAVRTLEMSRRSRWGLRSKGYL